MYLIFKVYTLIEHSVMCTICDWIYEKESDTLILFLTLRIYKSTYVVTDLATM